MYLRQMGYLLLLEVQYYLEDQLLLKQVLYYLVVLNYLGHLLLLVGL